MSVATGLGARVAALALLDGVQHAGLTLDDQAHDLGRLDAAERARALSLARGVLRDMGRLDAVIARYANRRPDDAVLDVLRLATWEICVDGVAPHAAVDSAVRLAKSADHTRRAAGLVNAVARRVADDGAPDWADLAPHALPAPLAGPIARSYGKGALAAIMAAHAQRPPLDITLKDPASARDWADQLGAQILPTGSLRLRDYGQVSTLAGFESGDWWVQDVAAAQPVRLVGDVAGLRVLDICAAPGGKTLQLAAAGAAVTALDISGPRLARLRENLARTGLAASIVTADALHWHPDAPFDVILLDAPCSASGTIRRHPDLPFVKELDDLRPLLALQADLLDRALGWLAPQGRLIYCTCSLLPAEGEGQIAKLQKRRPDMQVLHPDLPGGLQSEWLDAQGLLRLRPDYWPEQGGMDGFFAAMLANPS